MTYHDTYTDDSRDQTKNPKIICVAIESPLVISSVSNVISNNSRPSRMGTENLCGVDFCIIPMSNVGEGQFL